MFVGISISDLIGWYYPVAFFLVQTLIPLSIFIIAGLPLLNLIWCYVDRAGFHNGLQYKVMGWVGLMPGAKVYRYKGQTIYYGSVSRAKALFEGKGEAEAGIGVHVRDLRDVNSLGYSGHSCDCDDVTAKREDITKECFNKSVDDPRVLLLFVGALLTPLVWPAFVIAASLFIPVYLLRAARDGQKLAIKVATHIADAEVHVDDKADTSG
jgi:hypothetical protein